jgi:hypothetical protein
MSNDLKSAFEVLKAVLVLYRKEKQRQEFGFPQQKSRSFWSTSLWLVDRYLRSLFQEQSCKGLCCLLGSFSPLY